MAVATYTLSPLGPRVQDVNLASHRSFSTPQSYRLAALGQHARTYSENARTGQKRSLTPRASFSIGMDQVTVQANEENLSQATSREVEAGTPNAQPRSWLRRLSSNMSNISPSRDSSRAPSSRPGSAAVSQSNGSFAFSNPGSTTPMFGDHTPPPLPPNKLVKRSSSVRSTTSSPFQSSGSKLPLPVFRRPATSHQRSATFQERLGNVDQHNEMLVDEKFSGARDPQWRHYFTPRVAADEVLPWGRRRSSSGIPNPIRRVYPDRKYTPILVSARELVRPAQVETDDGVSLQDEDMAVTRLKLASSVASSPLPIQAAQFEEPAGPRRSFSIGDLLSTGPQPLWKRQPSTRSRLPTGRLSRKGRPTVTSAPRASMGSSLSSPVGDGSERPTKRRDLTDPRAAQRSIYSSSSSSQPGESQRHDIQLDTNATTPQSQHFGLADSPFADTPSQAVTPSSFEQRRLPSASEDSAAARRVRVSASHSEVPSTVGSDSERRSTGGYSTDYQSDTVYDSFPTRTTRSSSGKRGPPIDTIFDDSPPQVSSGRSTRLRDLLGDGQFPGSEYSARYRHSTIEEEESVVSTPVRSIHDKSVHSTPSARPGAQHVFTSSPPALPVAEDVDWDVRQDSQERYQGLGIHQTNHTDWTTAEKLAPRLNALSRSANATSNHSTPVRYSNGLTDKANLFDWSEHQPSPSNYNDSPPRPRTVHGKKDPETRGSRAPGRRAPSGMHARSHSVPVVPDVDGKRSVVANKFGTWGVGSKAVTEDWNEDFDFDEQPPPLPESAEEEEKRIDSGHEMFVPKSIREQQNNVVANISLLREWGLLIEELKDLRIRAVALDMLHGPYERAWQEVDAMIELADQESDEDTLQPRRSPPSSPGIDFGAFDDPMPSMSDASHLLPMLPDPALEPNPVQAAARGSPHQGTPPTTLAPRPRKDSEAVARSVIEALHSKRSVSEPTALKPVPPSKKVPFDTATLRHIVPYVNGLKRKVKDALRETEGLYSSPHRRSPPDDEEDWDEMEVDEPAFRSIFNGPQPDAPLNGRRLRRDLAMTDHDGSEDSSMKRRTDDLAASMGTMNLTRK